jgi:hypothetical protein
MTYDTINEYGQHQESLFSQMSARFNTLSRTRRKGLFATQIAYVTRSLRRHAARVERDRQVRSNCGLAVNISRVGNLKRFDDAALRENDNTISYSPFPSDVRQIDGIVA